MNFNNAGNQAKSLTKYILSGANENIKIWDITDRTNIMEIPSSYSNGTLSFLLENSGNKFREFMAVDISQDFDVDESVFHIVGETTTQNLHGLENPDFVIIAHSDFLEQAEKLARAHQEIDNMQVLVVTPEEIYNEFSSGTPDATAYRWLMKMFYERTNSGLSAKETKYLLLFGNGTFDNRNIYNELSDRNKTLTYQSKNSLVETSSYVTDDYFGFLDDSEGTSLELSKLDIAIGRFPVNTIEEAEIVVNKTISYMKNEHTGNWKNQLCYVADDGNRSGHVSQADELTKKIANLKPEFQIIKLYMDAFEQTKTADSESYPELKEKLWNQLEKGVLMFNYTGNGSSTALANEEIITLQDIVKMRNENLALWVTATCDFSRFDSGTTTAGDSVLLNENGGGVALFSTTRTVSSANQDLMQSLSEYIFSRDNDGKRLRLGDIIKKAKSSLDDSDKLSFALLGNPALTLAYPTQKVNTEKVEEKEADEADITINALSEVTIQGCITDNDDNKLSDFNGEVTITVLEKEEDITTLNNDGDAINGTFVFKNRPVISLGKAAVVNGEFTTTFMIPKDIDSEYGIGKIIYYAVDENTNEEAHGYFDNFTVGGMDNRVINDDEGPNIDMYLNAPSFASGDIVDDSPLFIAHLSDENGINSFGNNAVHNIVVVLDDKDEIILNDFYEPEIGTYKKGTVSYNLKNLSAGKHTLTFKVWDLLNNMSTAQFEFQIGNNVGISDLLPNVTPNAFILKHNCRNEILDVVLHVYDLSGRKLYSYRPVFSNQNGIVVIEGRNFATNFLGKIQKGVCLFKAEVISKNGIEVTETKKVIITGN